MKAGTQQDLGYDMLLAPAGNINIADIPFSNYVPPISHTRVEYVEVVEYVEDPEKMRLYKYVQSLGLEPEKLGEEPEVNEAGHDYIIFSQLLAKHEREVLKAFDTDMHNLLNQAK